MTPRALTRPLTTAAILLALSAAGCAVGPDYKRPDAPALAQWPDAAAPHSAAPAEPAPDLRHWWRTFNDPLLDSLIDRAFVAAPDLREAAARIREARALRGVAAADRLPTVDVGASASYDRTSGNTFGGPGGLPGEESDFYETGFDATWEIDLFGRIRRTVEAADAEVEAAVESARDARVILAAEVARHYLEHRSARARLAIAERNLRTQQETLELSRDRARAGLASDLEVAQATAQLETSRSQLPPLATAARQAAFRLDVLLGLPPGSLAADLEASAPVPATPASVAAGFPAELLRRRPDIRRAERALAAATARIGAAKADLYPRLTLSGSFGLASEDLGNLFESDSRTWGVGPLAVRWPIFDAGRIRSSIRVQEARQEQALIAYERTVLRAYEEVAGALVAYARLRERREALAAAVRADQQAVDMSSELWTRGLTDFLNVLDTQRALFVLQDQLAESDAALATSLVAIYKALGGGWDAEPPRAENAPDQPISNPAAPPAPGA